MNHPRPTVSHDTQAGTQFEIRLDTDPFWLSPLRAFVTDLAARADFDDATAADLRLAVDEAHSAMITAAADGEDVIGRFALADGLITVSVELTPSPLRARRTVPTDTFSWKVLRGMADEVELVPDGVHSTLGIRLTKARAGVRLRRW